MSKRALDTSNRPMARLLRVGYARRCRNEGKRILMKQMADELGINPDQISRYLSGTTVPYKDTGYFLEDLARVFQVPYSLVHWAARERPKKGIKYNAEGGYTTVTIEKAPRASHHG